MRYFQGTMYNVKEIQLSRFKSSHIFIDIDQPGAVDSMM